MSWGIYKSVFEFSCVDDVADCYSFRRLLTSFKDIFSKMRAFCPCMYTGDYNQSQMTIISVYALQAIGWDH